MHDFLDCGTIYVRPCCWPSGASILGPSHACDTKPALFTFGVNISSELDVDSAQKCLSVACWHAAVFVGFQQEYTVCVLLGSSDK